MEYEGKLYGKVGGEYFPMVETTEDINRYKQRIKELEEQVSNTDLLHGVIYCEHEPDKSKIDYSRLEDVPCLKCGKMVCIAPL